jgi:hypothetical protein
MPAASAWRRCAESALFSGNCDALAAKRSTHLPRRRRRRAHAARSRVPVHAGSARVSRQRERQAGHAVRRARSVAVCVPARTHRHHRARRRGGHAAQRREALQAAHVYAPRRSVAREVGRKRPDSAELSSKLELWRRPSRRCARACVTRGRAQCVRGAAMAFLAAGLGSSLASACLGCFAVRVHAHSRPCARAPVCALAPLTLRS